MFGLFENNVQKVRRIIKENKIYSRVYTTPRFLHSVKETRLNKKEASDLIKAIQYLVSTKPDTIKWSHRVREYAPEEDTYMYVLNTRFRIIFGFDDYDHVLLLYDMISERRPIKNTMK